MCLVEDRRPAETSGNAVLVNVKPTVWQDKRLETISLENIHIALTTHARERFTKRFPAQTTPREIGDQLRQQVRQALFVGHSPEASGKALFCNLYWEFILVLNPMRYRKALEIVVVSCWRVGETQEAIRAKKAKKYHRAREVRGWRKECNL